MKIILITGGNSEIGSTYIKEKGSEYDRIIVHYGRNRERIDKLVEMYGDKIIPFSADLSDSVSVQEMLESIKDMRIEIDAFLHVAAPKFRYTRFHKNNIHEFELEMNVVYWSYFMICRALLPGMVKRKKGKIVSILTEYTITSQPAYMAHYISSKYALLGLTKALSSEYASKNVQINAISPGMVETEFLSQIPHYIIEQNAQSNPNNKNLSPMELVPVINFLLSDESDKVSGQNILVK